MRDRGSRVGEGRRGGSSEGRAQPERGIIVKITYGPTSFMHAEEEESFGGGGGEKIARYSFLCRLLIISQLGRRDCLCSRFSLSLSFLFFFFSRTWRHFRIGKRRGNATKTSTMFELAVSCDEETHDCSANRFLRSIVLRKKLRND